MANWCSTTVIFTGSEKNLKSFYDDFMFAQEHIKEGCNDWIGRLLLLKGIDHEQIHCRGFYNYIEMEEDRITLLSEDAWSPCIETYDKFAEMYGLSYVLCAEEPGMGIYINTDTEHKYFLEKYIIFV